MAEINEYQSEEEELEPEIENNEENDKTNPKNKNDKNPETTLSDDDDDGEEKVEGENSDEELAYYADEDDNDDDDDEEINNEASALFLKQIWDAHCMTIQKQKQSKFLPATKKFLAAGFTQKEKMLNNNKQLISHLKNLAMGDDVKRLMLIDTEKYNTMIKNLDRLVANRQILDEAKQTTAEGELIEGHANMTASVAKKQPHATDDIINYSKKRHNYRKELAEKAAATAPAAATAGGGPLPKAGSLASSERLIKAFLKNNNVKDTPKGVKFQSKTLNFSFDDMIADLTKNVTKKKTNLNTGQHQKLLRELKKLNMPVSYIRSENLKGQYRSLSETGGGASTSQGTPPPAYETPPPPGTPQPLFQNFPTTPLSKKGQKRPYM
ncbi:Hypothetical predicted protein [Paramuricea clavata]|uniref:Uncharacterized protein n=1 Tax=Paramuricea clavata TaxID=317549 RepID=A0A7D9HAP3_PARCT|nr:Hypothetical predicted protein [Paramuricea clavata]